MKGIYYFSSTGNGLQIAKRVRERLGGKLIFIPNGGETESFDEIIIVSPVYSFGLPVPVYDLLGKLEKGKEVTAILHYGGMAGGADKLFYDYAAAHGLKVKSVYTIKMPENFTVFFTPPAFYTNAILKSANKRIDRISDDMERGKTRIPRRKITHEKTYLKNKSNWHLIGSTLLSATDDCVKCGKCVSVCPARNITIENGKVTFGDKCIACLGCYHRCPQKAIVYGKYRKKYRYFNPTVSEDELGKDE